MVFERLMIAGRIAGRRAVLGMALCAVAAPALHAQSLGLGAPDWTRETAALVLPRYDTSLTVQELAELTVTGADSDLLLLLDDTRSRNDWPEPVRDAAIFEYARGLADLPADAVPPVVMHYLVTYRPLTWVTHDDHAHGKVPLLNVRAVARGVEHGWLRQEARVEGMALLRARPGSLVDAWSIEGHPAVRAGYLEALEQSTAAQIASAGAAASLRLPADPELTALTGRAALLADDEEALHTMVRYGEGPALQHLLQALPTDDTARTLRLFESALGSQRTGNAALAMAMLYPPLAGIPDADAALLARLGDETLGAPAAMALAASPALDTRRALEALATTPDRPAARRAQLALDLRAERAQEALR